MDLNHPFNRCRKNNFDSGISASTMVQQLRLRFSGSETPKSAMRQLLLLVVVHGLLTPVQSVNGVIWDKEMADFVPIFSKPIFAAMNQERLSRSRAEETHNFQGRTFKFSYYEIDNVISSDKNGTSITGYIGDTWNVLAEYLNLTLKLDCVSLRTLGFTMNGTFSPGLLETIRLNQTDIIARVEAVNPRFQAAQFTFPFMYSRYSLFMQPKPHYVTTWMWKLFSRKVWFSVLATYAIFSVCSYIFHAMEADMFGSNMMPSMLDSFFNNFGMICTQYYDSTAMSKSSKMLEYLVGLFAVLINAAFNALVISYMTQVIAIRQIQDVRTLIETTEYNIFAVNGSLLHALFASGSVADHSSRSPKKRAFVVNNQTEVYRILCSSNLATTFLSEEIYRNEKYPCRLESVGMTIKVLISSGVSWQFENKRSIDVGLLKLYEIGLMNAIQRNWLRWWKEENNSRAPEGIVLEQVHFIHMVLLGGLVMSLIILILEQITFHCNK